MASFVINDLNHESRAFTVNSIHATR